VPSARVCDQLAHDAFQTIEPITVGRKIGAEGLAGGLLDAVATGETLSDQHADDFAVGDSAPLGLQSDPSEQVAVKAAGGGVRERARAARLWRFARGSARRLVGRGHDRRTYEAQAGKPGGWSGSSPKPVIPRFHGGSWQFVALRSTPP
jgi:hypothetical protein